MEIKLDGVEYLTMKETDILGTLTQTSAERTVWLVACAALEVAQASIFRRNVATRRRDMVHDVRRPHAPELKAKTAQRSTLQLQPA